MVEREGSRKEKKRKKEKKKEGRERNNERESSPKMAVNGSPTGTVKTGLTMA